MSQTLPTLRIFLNSPQKINLECKLNTNTTSGSYLMSTARKFEGTNFERFSKLLFPSETKLCPAFLLNTIAFTTALAP